ncbi:MAG: hypothetical protein SF182_15980 [Deltaproteobacteria bacterium]|nr:hypothetical protein [Deltaproteobacteria bacterium]
MTDADDAAAPASGSYYRGIIKRLFVGAGSGVVLSDTGREIPFLAPHVLLTGAVDRFANLREGMRVGFDVGWTSRGLRVTLLHTGDDVQGPGGGAA